MVWITKDFPSELWFHAEWLETNSLSWVTSQGHAEEQSMAITAKALLGQVTNFSIQHFSFKRYKSNNNKHLKIFIGTCILDHFSLASPCRLCWVRDSSHLRRASTWILGHRPEKRVMVSQALALPEQALSFATQYPLSVLSIQWYQLKGLSHVSWQPLKAFGWDRKIFEVSNMLREGDNSSGCLSVACVRPEGCCLTSFCILSLGSTGPHADLHALLFKAQRFASVSPTDTILFFD